jgi:hypothetical protein
MKGTLSSASRTFHAFRRRVHRIRAVEEQHLRGVAGEGARWRALSMDIGLDGGGSDAFAAAGCGVKKTPPGSRCCQRES